MSSHNPAVLAKLTIADLKGICRDEGGGAVKDKSSGSIIPA